MMTQELQQSRRAFLKTIGMGAVAGLTLPAFSAETTAGQKWQMKLATSSIMFKQLTLEETCSQISKLGFEAIDIWDKMFGCKHLDEAAKLGGAGLKELLAKYNLKISAFSVYSSGYPANAQLLGDIGGGVAIHGSAGAVKPGEQLTERMKKYLESLKPQVELAEKHNGYVAIENHSGALLHTLDSFKAFVDLNTSPRIGIALAPYHLMGLKASVPDAINICGRQLFFFYAWQKGGEFNQLPGHGPEDFKPWLDALAAIKYERYVNPFMHGHPPTDQMVAAVTKSRDYLKQLVN